MNGFLLTAAAAFGAGLVSFLSPCVLPLIPGYVSVITGSSPTELAGRRLPLSRQLVPSLMFVAGFTLVFVALGASASLLGVFLAPYKSFLTSTAAILIILMGIFMLGLIKVPGLYAEKRLDLLAMRSAGKAAPPLMGMAFAFGWTPCVGPILASILAIAGTSADVGKGTILLLVYSAGLGVPFVLVGLAFARLRGTMRFLSRHSLAVNRVAGVLLIVMGALMLTGRLAAVSGILLRFLPTSFG
ncbi:MAG: cytochrome c biogenesis protein CcdA [Coriobacteriales bacterium]|nr:cytochrome c biogenesis protein CcdA [Coriobacteriales bacterium]